MNSSSTDKPASELHPWVVLTETCLKAAKPGSDGLLRPERVKRLNVCVGRESLQRAVLIWDCILKGVKAGGLKVRMDKEPLCRTVVTVSGLELSIGIKEKTTRREHIPTNAERRRMRASEFFHGVPDWDYLPSGKLTLVIDYYNKHGDRINQVTWTDSPKKRIEDRLISFADTLSGIATRLKEQLARAEEQHRQWMEDERRRQEAARFRAEEEKRIDYLKRQVSAWELACSIRRFVGAVRDEPTRKGEVVEPGGPLDKWIRWALACADKVDPVPTLAAGLLPFVPTDDTSEAPPQSP